MQALLEVLAAAGVRHIFGNPGSTELSLNAALATDSRFTYILGLQEVPVAAMADGYAMASGGLGVACVHTCCGLGNAMGMLYNAYCEGSSLLVLAGQQDRRLRFEEPVLAGDMVSVARPWTKWATEIERVEDLPSAVRRAVQTALTPPTGPVFLSIPVDVQLTGVEGLDLTPPHVPDRRVRPPQDALNRAATLLAEACHPVILAGSRVVEAGAVAELVTLAELLGALVLADPPTSHGRLPMPADDPLYGGTVPQDANSLARRLADKDVVLAVGISLLRRFQYQDAEQPFRAGVHLIQMDSDSWELGKNYPVEIALVGDPQAGLAELVDMVALSYGSEQREAAARRRIELAARRADNRARLLLEMEKQRGRRPMSPVVMMEALARALPPDAAVVLEASAHTHLNVLERLGVLRDPTGHFGHRGWALGWGLGCAIGVKLAWPDRPAVALLGDGAALYTIQGLWSAAHHRVPVVFVIANNAQYNVLKHTADGLWVPPEKLVGLDLTEPEVDFVALSHGFGVEAFRVTEPDDLAQRVAAGVEGAEPLLLDVTIER
jgi:benzoylformate decarboxylase